MKRRIPALCSNEQAASSSIKRTKVHAQRKFAQGSNNFVYATPKILSKSPESSVSSTLQTPQPTNRVEKPECELNNFSSLPTIDDFLTFLCFRETEVLPERLNYLNTPQFDAPPSKKKSVKSNSVSFQEPKVEDSRDLNGKSNGKSKSSLKKKKTKVPEYPLRSRPAKSNIVRKPSHALALKHNQRLRSKSVVKAKCSENKLQSLKNKTVVLAKVIPHSSNSKNISPSAIEKTKARPLTRALDRKAIPSLLCDDDFKRVTRRNSTIDRNESLSRHCANHAIQKTIRMRPANHAVKKVVPKASKKAVKRVKASLPKSKSYVTDSNSDSTDTPSKPVTRSTRSGSVLQETIAPSTTNLRPSRRTKEAAALYMEMLGKELLCPDESFDDDDNISVESFPELPNTEELNRREKEIKEMHLKKSAASKSTPARKTSTPKPRAVAKVPLPEPVAATPAPKVAHKSVPTKEKVTPNVSTNEDTKNSGLCTRSKQYKPDTLSPAVGSTSTARKEQPSTSSSSVKIIRTRLKNDIVAAAAAAGANMGRRNSYNDAFDVAKCVSGFAKEFLVGQSKQLKNSSGGSREDVESGVASSALSDKKASETVANTESVTIKRLLSIAKFGGGDEKLKKASASRLKEDIKMKKFSGLGCARRSSEPVNIEQLKSFSSDDLKSVKSSESSDSSEADQLHRPDVPSAKPVAGKTLSKVTCLNIRDVSHSGDSKNAAFSSKGNGGNISNANKSGNGNASGDPVIIERIPSRKNSELKSAKRNRCPTSDEKATTLDKKKVEEIGSVKSTVTDSKSADMDRRSSFAETKSKIANHNLSVKSLKPTASVEVRAKKSPVPVTASSHQNAVTKVKNNCVVKSPKAVKTDSSVTVDAKTAKSKALATKVVKKKPSIYDLMTFDDSDDEFLIPPKSVIGKSTKRVDSDEELAIPLVAPKSMAAKPTRQVDSDDEISIPPRASKSVTGKPTKRVDLDKESLVPSKALKSVTGKPTRQIDSDEEILIPPRAPKSVVGKLTKRVDSDEEFSVPSKAPKTVTGKPTRLVDSDEDIMIPLRAPKSVIGKSNKRVDSDEELSVPPRIPKSVTGRLIRRVDSDEEILIPSRASKSVIGKSNKRVDSDEELSVPSRTAKSVSGKLTRPVDSDEEVLIPPRASKSVIGKSKKLVDSDEEFSVPPKAPKSVIGKPMRRVDSNEILISPKASVIGKQTKRVDSDEEFLIPSKAPKSAIGKPNRRIDSDEEILIPPKAPKSVIGKPAKQIESDDEFLIAPKALKPVTGKKTKQNDSDEEFSSSPSTPKSVIGKSTKRSDLNDKFFPAAKALKPVIGKPTELVDSDKEFLIPSKATKSVIGKPTRRIDSDEEILIPLKAPKSVIGKPAKRTDSGDNCLSAPKALKSVIGKPTKRVDSDEEFLIPPKVTKSVMGKSTKQFNSDDEFLPAPKAPKSVIGKQTKRIDSDDEFLIAPKAPKSATGKSTKQVGTNEQSDVSSTDDYRQVPKKASASSNTKCVSIELSPKTAITIAKEIKSCKEMPVFRAENAFNEKHTKSAVSKVAKPATSQLASAKSETPKRSQNICIVDEIIDLVTPKCEILDDSCDNQTFALDMYDESTEDCEKLSSISAPAVSKHNLLVTTSTCGSSGVGKGSESNVRGTGIKNTADFKKPAPQPPKSFFSAASACLKSKTVKEEKPPQSAVTTSQKMFSVDSKKLIFKKNSYLTPTAVGCDVKEENGAKKSEAFSPDNENSVYAFEPDLPTTSPPFRRLKPVTPPKSICSNSIAVQVNFENDGKIECSGSGDTQVSSTTDCGDRVFYIPIQTSADTTSTLGVAVKLGTDGPNQKIIMSAKLITDSTTFTTSSASTSISSKSTCVETCCTQTEPTKVSSIETAVKRPESTAAASKKGNSEKIVTSSDVTQTIQIPCTSASSSTKTNKKSSPTLPKPSSQSVKIVKLNKNKKLKELEMESLKSKSRPVKSKSAKKSSSPSTSDKAKAPPTPAGEIMEAPTFYPSAEEFNDPLEYIDTIRSVAEKYGLCRIVPPANFRPECRVADEMRFTAYNQYVHKMLHRWGPNVKEMMAIKKFLSTQKITLTQAPLIGSMEIDLPRLYQIVQQCGGLNAVIEKERWHQVADIMKIPKLAQDRITKLDYIYCKYLLPYDVLSHDEREKLFEEIEIEWSNHLRNPNDDDIFDDVDECIVKGRTMPLSSFYRIARNTMMMCFGNVEGQEGPSTEKIEEEFWNHVFKRKSHVCVHSGSIDSGSYGYGFSMAKNSTFRKHPWNLKVLTNNSASILRSLGPVMGVTVPTLHVGMLYSACCWYRDPHGLPWIEYLHTGANKIWYGIPDEHSEQFKEAMLLLVPRYCRDKKIWLPSDTVMIPPPLLTAQNISLSRVVQHPGQFIVVFPKAFTSSISTGYLVSESVYFAHASWLNSAKQVFKDMQDSCEPSVFSLDQLLINIAEDARSSVAILNKVLPLLTDLHDTEVALRNQLKELGLNSSEKMNTNNKKRKSKSAFSDEDLYECDVCRTNLFVSMVENSHDETYYCLRHAATFLYRKPAQAKHCKILYVYTEDELQTLTEKVKSKIEAKSGKKSLTK